MIKLSALDGPAELRAVALALRAASKDVRNNANQRMRATMNPAWSSAVNQHLTGAGRMEGRMLTAGVRINAGNPPVLIAANSTRKVGTGAKITPSDNWQGWEFGAGQNKTAKQKSRKGHTYVRHTTRQMPTLKRTGRVLYPALASVLPRMAAFYAQSVIRAYMDALDGGKR